MVALKVALPTLYLTKEITYTVLLFSLLLTGFFMHFLFIVFELTINDDLKTKNYFMLSL